MTKEGYKIFWEKAQYLFDEHEMDITGLTEAADEYAAQESKEFFKWYIMKVNNFIYYFKEVKPLTTSKEIEDKIAEFEGQTIHRLYELYLESKNKKEEVK